MEFDYVIVGGGSAGCALAARLSEDPSLRVCLLEAGGNGRGILLRAPVGAVALLPGRPKISNWAFQTVPQPGLNGRRGYQPRGRTLGGSSAINAMLYVRGQASDYDGWAALGCTGWGWAQVLPYFKRAENNAHGGDEMHGADGPLQVSDQQSPRPITRAFLAAAEQMQYRPSADFNRGDCAGVGLYQVTQFHEPAHRGERCSAAAAYLFPVMGRANLHVITQAQATRILFEDTADPLRATGVAYRRGRARKGGAEKTVHARREVILSGGAFNSPQLLQLSGIGSAGDLSALGIAPRHDLPGVGKNLQDHLDFILAYKSPDSDTFGIGLRGGVNLVRHILRWRKDGAGMIATPFAEGGAFLKTDPALEDPDVQLHFVIAIVDDHARKLHLGYGYSCHVCVLHPHSRGRVFLQSAAPMAAPGIDPQFLSDERDMARLIKGAKLTRAIMQAPAMDKYRGRELFMRGDESDAELAENIRARADTIYHPVGTCKMGVDKMAVVDPQLRVHGMRGLRVVDASVMPTLTGGNTNAPTIMIAEKAADMIRSEQTGRP